MAFLMVLLIASLFKKQNIFLNLRQKIKENIKDLCTPYYLTELTLREKRSYFLWFVLENLNKSGIFYLFDHICSRKFSRKYIRFGISCQREQLNNDKICCCSIVFIFVLEQIIFSFSYWFYVSLVRGT